MEIIGFRTKKAVMLISCCRDLEDWERGSLSLSRGSFIWGKYGRWDGFREIGSEGVRNGLGTLLIAHQRA